MARKPVDKDDIRKDDVHKIQADKKLHEHEPKVTKKSSGVVGNTQAALVEKSGNKQDSTHKARSTKPSPKAAAAPAVQTESIAVQVEALPDPAIDTTTPTVEPPFAQTAPDPVSESKDEPLEPVASSESVESTAAAVAEPVETTEFQAVPSEENPPLETEFIPPVEEPRHEEPRYVSPALDNKYLNKEALRHRLLLRMDYKPIIAYVGRLDFQKGVHLIRHGIFFALANNAQFVLLGTSPDPKINNEFLHLKHQLNDNPDCHLEIGFNEELSHLIYAGSDMVIMPSLYEPCGLTQMIALKYGTVPIVRAVGGLVDTVFDRDHSDRPYHERNGYVFHQADAAGLESAMRRAIGLWYSYPHEFRQLVINGMKYDYSWNHPGQHYLNIYEYIRCR